MLESCSSLTAATWSFGFCGVCLLARRLLFRLFAFAAAATARDDGRTDRHGNRLPVSPCIPQELLQMGRLRRITELHLLEQASILGDVDIIAVNPDRDFVCA